MKRIVSLVLAILALLSSAAKCAESAPSGAEATAGIPADAKRTVKVIASWEPGVWMKFIRIENEDAKGTIEAKSDFDRDFDMAVGTHFEIHFTPLLERRPQGDIVCRAYVNGVKIADSGITQSGECHASGNVPPPDTHA